MDRRPHDHRSFVLACAFVGSMSVLGCPSSKGQADGKSNLEDAAVVAKTSPSAGPVGSAPPAGWLSPDADGSLSFSWKVTNATRPYIAASAIAGTETLAFGRLDATADGDEDGTIDACAMKNKGPTSTLWCGGVPAYNFLTASLHDGALVVTLTRGVDGEPASETIVELVRRPTSAKTLRATGPASPLLYGNCRRGYVQRTADSPCLKQCLKGAGCKATETCQLIDVTGGDGPHKISACVQR